MKRRNKFYIVLFSAIIFSLMANGISLADDTDISTLHKESTYASSTPAPLFHSFIKNTNIQFVYSELPTSYSGNSKDSKGINRFFVSKLSSFDKYYFTIQLYSYFGLSAYDLIYPYHYFW